MELPANSVLGALDGQHNVVAFNSSFYYVNNQLAVTVTSPPPPVGSPVFTCS